MKALKEDRKKEFILIKLKAYCQQHSIAIKYATPYFYQKNDFTKRGQKSHVIIKNSLSIDSILPNNLWIEIIKTSSYLFNYLSIKSESYGELISEKK